MGEMLKCSQILLEAEDAKRVSQVTFLSEKDCTTLSGDDIWFHF